jgi:hypothetical protein
MEIDYTGLEMAFQRDMMDEATYWLDKETGRVLVLDDWARTHLRKAREPDELAHPRLRELWPLWCLVGREYEWGDEEEELEPWPEPPPGVTMDRYVQIPRIESYETYNDIVEYAATVFEDPRLRELLVRFLVRRHRDLRKITVDDPHLKEMFDMALGRFRLRARIDAWLESIGMRRGGEAKARREGIPIA